MIRSGGFRDAAWGGRCVDLWSGRGAAVLDVTSIRRESVSMQDSGVFVGLVDVVGGEDEEPLGFDGVEPSTREPSETTGLFDGAEHWLDDVLAFLIELGAFRGAQPMLHRRGRR